MWRRYSAASIDAFWPRPVVTTTVPRSWTPPSASRSRQCRPSASAPRSTSPRQAESLGYSSFWTAEVNGVEAFGLLGAVAQAAPGLSLGTGVLALQLRTPPLMAMAAATLQALSPERDIHVGIGISSPVVAGRWHGAGYGDRPLAQTREYITLLRACLSGEKVDFEGDFYSIKGFRLGVRLG